MSTKRRMLGINTKFDDLNIENFEEHGFSDNISYLDYDAVIINTTSIIHEYPRNLSGYENKALLLKTSSVQIFEDCDRTKEQINELLEHGKNLFVLMGENERFYTYRSNYGSPYELFDIYSFLPFKIKVTQVYGERGIDCGKQPYSDFFKKVDILSCYSAYFDIRSQNVLMTLSDSDKVLSSVVEYKNGKIIFLPFPRFKTERLERGFWQLSGESFVEEICKLNDRLHTSINDSVLPQWANKYLIFNEEEEESKLTKLQQKLIEAQKLIKEQEHLIMIIQRYKTLITSTGTQLEEIVKHVLSEMGFTLLDTEPGRSDVIAKYDNTDIVAEIKGVTKSAGEKHAAQLEKWVSLFIEEHNRSPKPLLVVNGYCDLPLSERTEDVFPNQMLKYSENRGHCLITTTQLLCLFVDVKQNPKIANSRITELLKTKGKYSQYENYEDYLPMKNGDK